jgi:hypothetical protein
VQGRARKLKSSRFCIWTVRVIQADGCNVFGWIHASISQTSQPATNGLEKAHACCTVAFICCSVALCQPSLSFLVSIVTGINYWPACQLITIFLDVIKHPFGVTWCELIYPQACLHAETEWTDAFLLRWNHSMNEHEAVHCLQLLRPLMSLERHTLLPKTLWITLFALHNT